MTALRRVLLVAVACLGLAPSSRADERELPPGEAIEVRPAAGDTIEFEGPGGQVVVQIDSGGMEGSGGGRTSPRGARALQGDWRA